MTNQTKVDLYSFINDLNEQWELHCTRWSSKGSIFTMLDSYFGLAKNPFIGFLDLVEFLLSGNVKHKDKVGECCWKHFPQWLEQQAPDVYGCSENEIVDRFLTEDIIILGARVSVGDKMRHFIPACHIFRFNERWCSPLTKLFSDQVKELAVTQHFHNYRSIIHIFEQFGDKLPVCDLIDDETLHGISRFLLFKKDGTSLRKILSLIKMKPRIYSVIESLDTLVGSEIQDKIVFEEISEEREPVFWHSSNCTIVTNLCDDLEIPVSHCPNVTYIRMKEKTKLLVHSTFGNGAEMDLKTFRELVLKFSSIDDRYRKFIVDYLYCLGHVSESRRLNSFLNNSSDHMSDTECYEETDLPKSVNLEKYYKLPIKDDAIMFIDSLEKYNSAMSLILSKKNCLNKRQRLIGIDTEWPGVLPPGQRLNLSILQLSLIDKVFIIDLENLASGFSKNDWLLLFELFAAKELKKLTFSFSSDQLMLKTTFPADALGDFEMTNNCDLEQLTEQLWKMLKALDHEVVPLRNGDIAINIKTTPMPCCLSDVAEIFLGRGINKMFRMSNWSRRPLDKKQLLYAATDAFCLIDIYLEMLKVISSQNLQLSPDNIIVDPSCIAGDTRGVVGEPAKNLCTSTKFLCDPILNDLGHYLTLFGCNVKTWSPDTNDVNVILNEAFLEDRAVITTEASLAAFSNYVCDDEDDDKVCVVAVPVSSIEEMVTFLSLRFHFYADCEKIKPSFLEDATQRLQCSAAHLRDRGNVHYEFVTEKQPFVACCVLVTSDGSISKTRAVAPSKNEAKRRAAASMLLKLASEP